MASSTVPRDLPWHLGIFDAHCHPTDTLAALQEIPGMRANVLTVMATRAQDQDLVAEATDKYGITQDEAGRTDMDWSSVHKIIPAFGWHPWFSHQMFNEDDYENVSALNAEQKVSHYQNALTPKSEDRSFLLSLPDPRPFGAFLARTKSLLGRYPLALIGEIGLDKSFRIPEAWLPGQADQRDNGLTPGGREGRTLSPYRVSIEHQKKVLAAQLRLAGEMQRAVSVHGVQAHGLLYETLAETWKGHERHVVSRKEKKRSLEAVRLEAELGTRRTDAEVRPQSRPFPPRICLHSFSGPAETVKQYVASQVPCDVFFSFSTTINAWSEDGHGKVERTVKAVPDDRILIESDLHTAGDRMDGYLAEIVYKLCDVKGWDLETGVRQLGRNWRTFALGQTYRYQDLRD